MNIINSHFEVFWKGGIYVPGEHLIQNPEAWEVFPEEMKS